MHETPWKLLCPRTEGNKKVAASYPQENILLQSAKVLNILMWMTMLKFCSNLMKAIAVISCGTASHRKYEHNTHHVW